MELRVLFLIFLSHIKCHHFVCFPVVYVEPQYSVNLAVIWQQLFCIADTAPCCFGISSRSWHHCGTSDITRTINLYICSCPCFPHCMILLRYVNCCLWGWQVLFHCSLSLSQTAASKCVWLVWLLSCVNRDRRCHRRSWQSVQWLCRHAYCYTRWGN